jgi:intergrase/recombinase
VVGLPGFEPGSFPHKAHANALREPKSNKILSKEGINWKDFEKWLQNRLNKAYAAKVRSYAKKYCYVLFEPSKASVLSGYPKAKRRNIMAALANLAKFLGMYKDWKEIVSQADLRWQKTSHLEVFVNLLNTDIGEVRSWLVDAIQKLPVKYSAVLVFAAVTGLRPEEAFKSVRLISELAEAGRLESYLNSKLNMLEHFRFPDLFLRGNKNAYISFVPESVLKLILAVKPRVSSNGLRKALKKTGLKVRIKDLRKLFATTVRDNDVPEEVVDLLQGRIPQSIFLRHYYKPELLKDVRERVLKAVEAIPHSA